MRSHAYIYSMKKSIVPMVQIVAMAREQAIGVIQLGLALAIAALELVLVQVGDA
jgi:hypothetical protein